MKIKLTSLLFFIFLMETISLFSQAGILNTNFGDDGIVVTQVGQLRDEIIDIAILPDGKIIAGGYTSISADSTLDFALVQYHADGSIDEDFGDQGKATLDFFNDDDFPKSILVQPDGKIILGGIASFDPSFVYALARFEADGSIDNSFGIDGKVFTDLSGGYDSANSLALQADGKILLGGNNRDLGGGTTIAIVRYHTDGTIDTTFGIDGIAENEDLGNCTEIGFQSDGKIVSNAEFFNPPFIIGLEFEFAVTRFNQTGTVDSTFGLNGFTAVNVGIYDNAEALYVQSDDKILIAGESQVSVNAKSSIIRFDIDGQIDSTFSDDGVFTFDLGLELVVCNDVYQQDDGKIIATGRAGNFDGTFGKLYVIRLLENGTFDTSFGDEGVVLLGDGVVSGSEGYAIIHQPNNTITVGGYVYYEEYQNADFLLVQFISEMNVGVLEFSEVNNQITVYPNPVIENITFKYTLTKKEKISIDLYSLDGKHIKSFLSNQEKIKGEHQEKFQFGSTIPSGHYILTIKNESEQTSYKIIK